MLNSIGLRGSQASANFFGGLPRQHCHLAVSPLSSPDLLNHSHVELPALVRRRDDEHAHVVLLRRLDRELVRVEAAQRPGARRGVGADEVVCRRGSRYAAVTEGLLQRSRGGAHSGG